MSQKSRFTSPRVCCERFHKRQLHSEKSNDRNTLRNSELDVSLCTNKNKSTTDFISNRTVAKPKKTSKSDVIFCKSISSKYKSNCMQNCGDCKGNASVAPTNTRAAIKQSHSSSTINDNSTKILPKSVQQYYRNENFLQSTDSIRVNGHEKVHSLNTIKEQSEKHSDKVSYGHYSASSSGFIDFDNFAIDDIKQFREENYFECHSTNSRIKNKGSATCLNNHKCVYRFYLNDRLFPVPINKDYNNKVRCIECNLPLDPASENISGTIQAKVKLSNQVQDMMLMLPITKSLIFKERRKLKETVQDECLYFGIIKMDLNGDSLFNRNVPGNSYALKYQKGYKEYVSTDKYKYENVEENNVIRI